MCKENLQDVPSAERALCVVDTYTFLKGSSERGAEPAKNAYNVRLMIKMFVTENLGRILPMTACVKKHDIIPQDVCIYRYIYIPY